MAEHTDDATGAPHEEHPRGTLVLMLGFLALTAALWGWVYVLLLSRG